MVYSSISEYLGFGQLGSGKVMGLAPYGKEDPNKTLCLSDKINSNLFNRVKEGLNSFRMTIFQKIKV